MVSQSNYQFQREEASLENNIGVFLKAQDKYSKQIRPKRGIAYIQLLHQIAPAQKANQVKDYCIWRANTSLYYSILPYSSNLAPFCMFYSKRHKKMLTGRTYLYKMSVGFAVYQCLKSAP